jgi:hypothetical protein
MGIRRILLPAAALAIIVSPCSARHNNVTTRIGRATAAAKTTVAARKLREAKRHHRVAVIPTDVRVKRYLAFGDELDMKPGRVQPRQGVGGDAISDGP